MPSDGDRASRPGVIPEAPQLTDDDVALIEARNGLRQFDRMVEMIEAANTSSARFRLRPSTIMELNRYAVDGLMVAPGSYRITGVTITGTKHVPPEAEEVPVLTDYICDYVNDNWDATPVHLAAYIMWRLNWVHPFPDGNGRTSRIVSYLVMCARLGYRVPGTKTIPERIAASKQPYYAALDDADAAWKQARLDVSKMEQLIASHLAEQLVEIHSLATGQIH